MGKREIVSFNEANILLRKIFVARWAGSYITN